MSSLPRTRGNQAGSTPREPGGRVIGEFVERKIRGLTIRIDRRLCISTSNCMKVAPEVFEFDDENICAYKESLPDIERERLIDACDVCPVDALIVIDENDKRLVP
ncbi:MAG: ferredoxin [Candidatus Methylomirabilales bacterium]